MDHSLYLRTKNCCKKVVEVCTPGPEGPQGPEGPPGPAGSITNALLFYQDISLVPPNGNQPDISICIYDANDTSYNGVERFIDTNGYITFTDLSNCSNSMVEIYVHCDAEAISEGQSNYVKFDLSGISIEPDSLSVVDIDTRSVEKGAQEHLSFGPCLYKVLNTTSANTNKCIHTNNTYVLRVESGREYDLTEIKFIIKVISCET